MLRPLLLLLLLGILILLSIEAYAQGPASATAETAWLRSASSWSTLGNTAGLAEFQAPEVGLAASRPHGLPELSAYTVVAHASRRNHHAGLALETAGFGGWRQNRLSLAYATPFLRRWVLGIRWQGQLEQWPEGPARTGHQLDAGLLYHANDRLSLGAHTTRLHGLRSLILGGWHRLGSATTAQLDVLLPLESATPGQTATIRMGLRHRLSRDLEVLAGYAPMPTLISAGLSVAWYHWHLLFASAWQVQLGVSTTVSLTYFRRPR